MKKFLKIIIYFIFILVFISLEYLFYVKELFLSFNLCILLYLWLSFVYKIYGLKKFADNYKKNYPIKFKLSFIYLLKIIARSLKIKWVLLKIFLIKLRTRQLGLREFLIFATILIISFLIYKYYINNFMLEISSMFFYYLLNLLTLFSLVVFNWFNFLIKELINTLQKLFPPENNFMYLCITERVKEEVQKESIKSWILNYVMLMKKHASEFMGRRSSKKLIEDANKTIINCDPSIASPVYPERSLDINGNIIPSKELKKQIQLLSGPLSYYIPKYTMNNNILYPIAKSNDYYLHNNILMPYKMDRLSHLVDYLNENNADNRVNLLNNNSYDFFQDLRVLYICDVNQTYENQSNPKFLKFRSEYPIEARRVYDILYFFKNLAKNDFTNIYSNNYLKIIKPGTPLVFQHFIYELCHIQSIMKEYSNREIYGLPSTGLKGEADAILIDEHENVDLVQLKSRTSFREFKKTTHELAFSLKYSNTPVSFCFFRNIYFSIWRLFTENNILISQTINIKPIPNTTSPILSELNDLNNKTSVERINELVDRARQHTNNINNLINDEK